MPQVSRRPLPHRCRTVHLRLPARVFRRRGCAREPALVAGAGRSVARFREAGDGSRTTGRAPGEPERRREGREHVLITGGAQDQALLENIAVHVRKAGAFPLVTLNSERMAKRLFDDVRSGGRSASRAVLIRAVCGGSGLRTDLPLPSRGAISSSFSSATRSPAAIVRTRGRSDGSRRERERPLRAPQFTGQLQPGTHCDSRSNGASRS